MSKPRSYDASSTHRSLNAEVERLRDQALMCWEKEARTLEWFGLRNGMSVLELGSGPGFITEQLLAMLPDSAITALEIDPTLIEKAEQYLKEYAGSRLRFVEASITHTGLPDNSYDFAIARLVFQHLPKPEDAAIEILRVLKPGGKLVIVDSDDAIWGLSDPEIPEMGLILEKYGQAQAARGGNRLVGRQLWRILERSGFKDLDLEVVIAHSDAAGIDQFLHQMDPDRLLILVKGGLISEEELSQVRVSHGVLLAADRPYILMVLLMACGRKP